MCSDVPQRAWKLWYALQWLTFIYLTRKKGYGKRFMAADDVEKREDSVRSVLFLKFLDRSVM